MSVLGAAGAYRAKRGDTAVATAAVHETAITRERSWNCAQVLDKTIPTVGMMVTPK